MRTFRGLTSMEEATGLIEEHTGPIDRLQIVSLADALERVLGEDIKADFDVPSRDRSAMDGYAVVASDTLKASSSRPVRLRLGGKVSIGQTPKLTVRRGECAAVSTGCFIPDGADAVLMHENTETDAETVVVYKPAYVGENISVRGSDVKKGSVPLRIGDFITPARVGVLASLGRAVIRVFDKPNVSIIPTGPELTKVGFPLEEEKIYDINSHTLSAVVTENGGSPELRDPIMDDRESIAQAIENSMDSDLIVVAGGSSVGERDLMYDVLSNMGQVLFHGVQIKPGKPTICAHVRGKLVLGMPGHPTSCLSNAYLLLMPIVRKLAHLPPRRLTTVRAKLSRRIVSTLGRKVFMTVRLCEGQAEPVYKESSAITSMADADGYIVIPENTDTIEKGDEVEVSLFY